MSKSRFQTCTRKNIALRADSPTVVVLPYAKPLAGELLSPDGRPVAGAKIRQYMKSSPTGGSFLDQAGPVLAVSDAKGYFTLDTLEDDASYFLVAESAEYGRASIRVDLPRSEKLSVQFGPLLTVSGVVLGPLDKLMKTDGKPSIYFSQPISLKHCSTSWAGNAIVETIDGRQRFTVRGLLPGEVSIVAGWSDSQRYVRTKVDAATPHQEVTIDLTQPVPPPVKRPVILRLTTPDGATPKGAVHVRVVPADGGYSERDDMTVPLKDGVARVEAYVSGTIDYSPRGLIGYWFPWENSQRKVEAGKAPLEIDVPVTPAGAIAGRVLDAEGKPVSDKVSVNLNGRKMDTSNGTIFCSGDFGGGTIRVDRQGKFWINPLPLGWKYAISVSRGHAVCYTEPIELTGAKPTAEATLSLPRTVSVEGRVLDQYGKPLAVPLELSFVSNTKSLAGGFSSQGWSDTLSNHQGIFRFDDLGFSGGEYFLYLKPRKDFQPRRVPLPLDGRPIEVRLNPGFVLEGTVLNDATGKPAAGLEIYALPAKFTPDSIRREAESRTDDHGRFRFSNLGDEAYRIGVQGGPQIVSKLEDGDGLTWKPGDLTVIEFRVKIPAWFRPRE